MDEIKTHGLKPGQRSMAKRFVVLYGLFRFIKKNRLSLRHCFEQEINSIAFDLVKHEAFVSECQIWDFLRIEFQPPDWIKRAEGLKW